MVAVLLRAVAVLNVEWRLVGAEAGQPLARVVGQGFGAVDGEDEVLAEALLDDLFCRVSDGGRLSGLHQRSVGAAKGAALSLELQIPAAAGVVFGEVTAGLAG